MTIINCVATGGYSVCPKTCTAINKIFQLQSMYHFAMVSKINKLTKVNKIVEDNYN